MTPQDIQRAPGPHSTAISMARAQAGKAVFAAGTGPAPPGDDPDPDGAVRPLGGPLDGPLTYLSNPYAAAHRTANRFADAAVTAFLSTLAATELSGLSVSEVWEAIGHGA